MQGKTYSMVGPRLGTVVYDRQSDADASDGFLSRTFQQAFIAIRDHPTAVRGSVQVSCRAGWSCAPLPRRHAQLQAGLRCVSCTQARQELLPMTLLSDPACVESVTSSGGTQQHNAASRLELNQLPVCRSAAMKSITTMSQTWQPPQGSTWPCGMTGPRASMWRACRPQRLALARRRWSMCIEPWSHGPSGAPTSYFRGPGRMLVYTVWHTGPAESAQCHLSMCSSSMNSSAAAPEQHHLRPGS